MLKQNESKRKIPKQKKNTEVKQSEKKNMGNEKKRKVYTKFSLTNAKQKRNESCFTLKRQIFFAKPAHPRTCLGTVSNSDTHSTWENVEGRTLSGLSLNLLGCQGPGPAG
jgi:hypothetical protein